MRIDFDNPIEPEPGLRQQIIKFLLSAFLAGQLSQHNQIQQQRSTWLVVFRDQELAEQQETVENIGGYPSQPCGLRSSIELRNNASLSDAIAVFYRKTLIGRQ